MTPEEFSEHRQRTANTFDVTHADQLLNVALGLGEVGELQNEIKKHIFHEHPWEQSRAKIIDEAGDVEYYLDWLYDLIDVSRNEVLEHNIAKLQARYPNGWESERSINRGG